MFCNQDAYAPKSLDCEGVRPQRVYIPTDASGRKCTFKYNVLRPFFDYDFSDVNASKIAQDFLRYIKGTRKYKKETTLFVEDILNKILFLHKYNLKVAEVTFKYPLTTDFTQLLLHYVVLECNVLYRREFYSTRRETVVEKRILRVLISIYNAYLETSSNVPLKKLCEESAKAVLNLLIKIKPEFDIQNKLLENTVIKLLNKIGKLEKVTALQGKHIPCPLDTYLSDPLVVNTCKNIITSDYGTDDDLRIGEEEEIHLISDQEESDDDNSLCLDKEIKMEINDFLRTSQRISNRLHQQIVTGNSIVPTIYIDDDDYEMLTLAEEVKTSNKSRKMLEKEEQNKIIQKEKQNQTFCNHKPLQIDNLNEIKSEVKEEIIDLDCHISNERCASIKSKNRSHSVQNILSNNNTIKEIVTGNMGTIEGDILILSSDEDEACDNMPCEKEIELLKHEEAAVREESTNTRIPTQENSCTLPISDQNILDSADILRKNNNGIVTHIMEGSGKGNIEEAKKSIETEENTDEIDQYTILCNKTENLTNKYLDPDSETNIEETVCRTLTSSTKTCKLEIKDDCKESGNTVFQQNKDEIELVNGSSLLQNNETDNLKIIVSERVSDTENEKLESSITGNSLNKLLINYETSDGEGSGLLKLNSKKNGSDNVLKNRAGTNDEMEIALCIDTSKEIKDGTFIEQNNLKLSQNNHTNDITVAETDLVEINSDLIHENINDMGTIESQNTNKLPQDTRTDDFIATLNIDSIMQEEICSSKIEVDIAQAQIKDNELNICSKDTDEVTTQNVSEILENNKTKEFLAISVENCEVSSDDIIKDMTFKETEGVRTEDVKLNRFDNSQENDTEIFDSTITVAETQSENNEDIPTGAENYKVDTEEVIVTTQSSEMNYGKIGKEDRKDITDIVINEYAKFKTREDEKLEINDDRNKEVTMNYDNLNRKFEQDRPEVANTDKQEHIENDKYEKNTLKDSHATFIEGNYNTSPICESIVTEQLNSQPSNKDDVVWNTEKSKSNSNYRVTLETNSISEEMDVTGSVREVNKTQGEIFEELVESTIASDVKESQEVIEEHVDNILILDSSNGLHYPTAENCIIFEERVESVKLSNEKVTTITAVEVINTDFEKSIQEHSNDQESVYSTKNNEKDGKNSIVGDEENVNQTSDDPCGILSEFVVNPNDQVDDVHNCNKFTDKEIFKNVEESQCIDETNSVLINTDVNAHNLDEEGTLSMTEVTVEKVSETLDCQENKNTNCFTSSEDSVELINRSTFHETSIVKSSEIIHDETHDSPSTEENKIITSENEILENKDKEQHIDSSTTALLEGNFNMKENCDEATSTEIGEDTSNKTSNTFDAIITEKNTEDLTGKCILGIDNIELSTVSETVFIEKLDGFNKSKEKKYFNNDKDLKINSDLEFFEINSTELGNCKSHVKTLPEDQIIQCINNTNDKDYDYFVPETQNSSDVPKPLNTAKPETINCIDKETFHEAVQGESLENLSIDRRDTHAANEIDDQLQITIAMTGVGNTVPNISTCEEDKINNENQNVSITIDGHFNGSLLKKLDVLKKIGTEVLIATNNTQPSPEKVVQGLEICEIPDKTSLDILATVATVARREIIKGRRKRTQSRNKHMNKRITKNGLVRTNEQEKCKPHDFLVNNIKILPPVNNVYTHKLAEINVTSEDSNDSEGNLLIDEDIDIKSNETVEEIIKGEDNLVVADTITSYDEDTLLEDISYPYEPKRKPEQEIKSSSPDNYDKNREKKIDKTQNVELCKDLTCSDLEFAIPSQIVKHVPKHIPEMADINDEKPNDNIAIKENEVLKGSCRPFRTMAERKDYDKLRLNPYVSIERLNIHNKVGDEVEGKKTRSKSFDIEIIRHCEKNLDCTKEDQTITNKPSTEDSRLENFPSYKNLKKEKSKINSGLLHSDLDDIPLSQRVHNKHDSKYKAKSFGLKDKKEKEISKNLIPKIKCSKKGTSNINKSKPKRKQNKISRKQESVRFGKSTKSSICNNEKGNVNKLKLKKDPENISCKTGVYKKNNDKLNFNESNLFSSTLKEDVKGSGTESILSDNYCAKSGGQTIEKSPVKVLDEKYYTTPKLRRKSACKDNQSNIEKIKFEINQLEFGNVNRTTIDKTKLGIGSHKKYCPPPKLRGKTMMEGDNACAKNSILANIPFTQDNSKLDMLSRCKNTVSPTTEKLKKKLETDFNLSCNENNNILVDNIDTEHHKINLHKEFTESDDKNKEGEEQSFVETPSNSLCSIPDDKTDAYVKVTENKQHTEIENLEKNNVDDVCVQMENETEAKNALINEVSGESIHPPPLLSGESNIKDLKNIENQRLGIKDEQEQENNLVTEDIQSKNCQHLLDNNKFDPHILNNKKVKAECCGNESYIALTDTKNYVPQDQKDIEMLEEQDLNSNNKTVTYDQSQIISISDVAETPKKTLINKETSSKLSKSDDSATIIEDHVRSYMHTLRKYVSETNLTIKPNMELQKRIYRSKSDTDIEYMKIYKEQISISSLKTFVYNSNITGRPNEKIDESTLSLCEQVKDALLTHKTVKSTDATFNEHDEKVSTETNTTETKQKTVIYDELSKKDELTDYKENVCVLETTKQDSNVKLNKNEENTRMELFDKVNDRENTRPNKYKKTVETSNCKSKEPSSKYSSTDALNTVRRDCNKITITSCAINNDEMKKQSAYNSESKLDTHKHKKRDFHKKRPVPLNPDKHKHRGDKLDSRSSSFPMLSRFESDCTKTVEKKISHHTIKSKSNKCSTDLKSNIIKSDVSELEKRECVSENTKNRHDQHYHSKKSSSLLGESKRNDDLETQFLLSSAIIKNVSKDHAMEENTSKERKIEKERKRVKERKQLSKYKEEKNKDLSKIDIENKLAESDDGLKNTPVEELQEPESKDLKCVFQIGQREDKELTSKIESECQFSVTVDITSVNENQTEIEETDALMINLEHLKDKPDVDAEELNNKDLSNTNSAAEELTQNSQQLEISIVKDVQDTNVGSSDTKLQNELEIDEKNCALNEGNIDKESNVEIKLCDITEATIENDYNEEQCKKEFCKNKNENIPDEKVITDNKHLEQFETVAQSTENKNESNIEEVIDTIVLINKTENSAEIKYEDNAIKNHVIDTTNLNNCKEFQDNLPQRRNSTNEELLKADIQNYIESNEHISQNKETDQIKEMSRSDIIDKENMNMSGNIEADLLTNNISQVKSKKVCEIDIRKLKLQNIQAAFEKYLPTKYTENKNVEEQQDNAQLHVHSKYDNKEILLNKNDYTSMDTINRKRKSISEDKSLVEENALLHVPVKKKKIEEIKICVPSCEIQKQPSTSPRKRERKSIESIVSHLVEEKVNKSLSHEDISKAESTSLTVDAVDVTLLKKKLLQKMKSVSDNCTSSSNIFTNNVNNYCEDSDKYEVSKVVTNVERGNWKNLIIKEGLSAEDNEASSTIECIQEDGILKNVYDQDKPIDVIHTMTNINSVASKYSQDEKNDYIPESVVKLDESKIVTDYVKETADIEPCNSNLPSQVVSETLVSSTSADFLTIDSNSNDASKRDNIYNDNIIDTAASSSTSFSNDPLHIETNRNSMVELDTEHCSKHSLGIAESSYIVEHCGASVQQNSIQSSNLCSDEFSSSNTDECSDILNLSDLMINVDGDPASVTNMGDITVSPEDVCMFSDIISTTISSVNSKLFSFPVTSQTNTKGQFNQTNPAEFVTRDGKSCVFPFTKEIDSSTEAISSTELSLNLQDAPFNKMSIGNSENLNLVSPKSLTVVQSSSNSNFIDEISDGSEMSDIITNIACSAEFDDHNYTSSIGGPLLGGRPEEKNILSTSFNKIKKKVSLDKPPDVLPLNDNHEFSEFNDNNLREMIPDDTYKLNLYNEYAVKKVLMLAGQTCADTNGFPLFNYNLANFEKINFIECSIPNSDENSNSKEYLETNNIEQKIAYKPIDLNPWTQFIMNEDPNQKVLVLPNEQCFNPSFSMSQQDLMQSFQNQIEDAGIPTKFHEICTSLNTETGVKDVAPNHEEYILTSLTGDAEKSIKNDVKIYKEKLLDKPSQKDVIPKQETYSEKPLEERQNNVDANIKNNLQKIKKTKLDKPIPKETLDTDFLPKRSYRRTVLRAPPKKKTAQTTTDPSKKATIINTNNAVQGEAINLLINSTLPEVGKSVNPTGPENKSVLTNDVSIINEVSETQDICDEDSKKIISDIKSTADLGQTIHEAEKVSSQNSFQILYDFKDSPISQTQSPKDINKGISPKRSLDIIESISKKSEKPAEGNLIDLNRTSGKKLDVQCNIADLVKSRKRAATNKYSSNHSPTTTFTTKELSKKPVEAVKSKVIPINKSSPENPFGIVENKLKQDLLYSEKEHKRTPSYSRSYRSPQSSLSKSLAEQEGKRKCSPQVNSNIQKSHLENVLDSSVCTNSLSRKQLKPCGTVDNKITGDHPAVDLSKTYKNNHSIDSILSKDSNVNKSSFVNENELKGNVFTNNRGMKRSSSTLDKNVEMRKMDKKQMGQSASSSQLDGQKDPFDQLLEQGCTNKLIRLKVTKDNKIKTERRGSPLTRCGTDKERNEHNHSRLSFHSAHRSKLSNRREDKQPESRQRSSVSPYMLNKQKVRDGYYTDDSSRGREGYYSDYNRGREIDAHSRKHQSDDSRGRHYIDYISPSIHTSSSSHINVPRPSNERHYRSSSSHSSNSNTNPAIHPNSTRLRPSNVSESYYRNSSSRPSDTRTNISTRQSSAPYMKRNTILSPEKQNELLNCLKDKVLHKLSSIDNRKNNDEGEHSWIEKLNQQIDTNLLAPSNAATPQFIPKT